MLPTTGIWTIWIRWTRQPTPNFLLFMRGSVIRSACFAEERNQQAKQLAREAYGSVEFWFRRKYNLTRTDPRFLEATVEDMLEDLWMHTYYDDPEAVTKTVEDDDFDEESVAERLLARKQKQEPPLPNDFEELS